MRQRVAASYAAIAAAMAFAGAVASPPQPVVVSGQATFAQQGNVFSITNTPNTIINWQSFSIQPGEITRFIQQSASSAVLNRILGQDPSQILGALQSNGQVYLINPNGFLFGKDARVDVAGLTASTLNLSNADFLAGKRNFSGSGGTIANQGTISTPSGGSIFLLASSVENSGILSAPNGDVVLAAGHTVQLVDSNNPDLHVVVSAPSSQAVNLGQVVAQGGRIGIYGALVKQGGRVNADSAVIGANGKIVLKSSGDTLLETGSATSAAGAGQGGSIDVLGQRVGVAANATIDASGGAGGGAVRVGGDFHGANAAVPNASVVFIDKDASISADAGARGNGGTIAVWADDTTRMYGSLSARGGTNGGDGGFAESSGRKYLDFQGKVDLLAPKGKAGTLLLDPSNITISAAATANISTTPGSPYLFDQGTGSSIVNVTDLTNQLASSNVLVNATNGSAVDNGDITVASAISWGNSNILALEAQRNININAAISNTSTGQLALRALTGDIIQNSGAISVPDVVAWADQKGVLLNSATNNITNVAGVAGSSGSGFTLVSTGALNVKSLTNNFGTTAGITTSNTNINLTSGGALIINSGNDNLGLVTGLGNVTVTSGGNVFENRGKISALSLSVTGSGVIDLTSSLNTANTNDFSAVAVTQNSSGGGGISIKTGNGASTLTLGTISNASSSGSIVVDTTAGGSASINLVGQVSLANASGSIQLNAGSTGTITQGGSNTVKANTINLNNASTGAVGTAIAPILTESFSGTATLGYGVGTGGNGIDGVHVSHTGGLTFSASSKGRNVGFSSSGNMTVPTMTFYGGANSLSSDLDILGSLSVLTTNGGSLNIAAANDVTLNGINTVNSSGGSVVITGHNLTIGNSGIDAHNTDGTDGNITMTAAGYICADTSGLLHGGTVSLTTSSGIYGLTSSDAVSTSANTLNLHNTGAGIVRVSNNKSLSLGTIAMDNAGTDMYLSTTSGSLLSANDIANPGGTTTLTSAGAISVADAKSVTADQVALSAATGIYGTNSTTPVHVNANLLNLYNTGAGPIRAAASSGNLVLNAMGANSFAVQQSTSGQVIDLTAAGNLVLAHNLNNSGGSTTLTATAGAISQGSGRTATSDSLKLVAANGITGNNTSTDPFVVHANLVSAENNSSGSLILQSATGSNLVLGPISNSYGAHQGAAGGPLTLTAPSGFSISTTGDIVVNGGAANLTAGSGVGFNGSAGMTTAGGPVTITASDANGLFNMAGGGTIASGNGMINVYADKLDMAGGFLNAGGSGTVSITPTAVGRLINIGSNIDTTANTLEISTSEMANLTGYQQYIGSNASGDLTLSAALSRPGRNLNFTSGGNISVAGDLTAANINLNAGGTLTTSANISGVLIGLYGNKAVLDTGKTITASSSFSIASTSKALSLGSSSDASATAMELSAAELATLHGQDLSLQSASGQDITVSNSVAFPNIGSNVYFTSGKDIVVNSGATLSAAYLSLTSGSGGSLTNNGSIVVTHTLDTATSHANLAGGTISAHDANLKVLASAGIELGGTAASADSTSALGLNDAELQTISAVSLTIGEVNDDTVHPSGTMTIGAVSPLTNLSGDLNLYASDMITVNGNLNQPTKLVTIATANAGTPSVAKIVQGGGAGKLTASTLSLSAESGVGTIATPLQTAVGTLNVDNGGANDISIKNTAPAGGFTLNDVGQSNYSGAVSIESTGNMLVNYADGLDTGSGALTLKNNGGNLTIDTYVMSDTGALAVINSGGTLQLTSGHHIASNSGAVTLSNTTGSTQIDGLISTSGAAINIGNTDGGLTVSGSGSLVNVGANVNLSNSGGVLAQAGTLGVTGGGTANLSNSGGNTTLSGSTVTDTGDINISTTTGSTTKTGTMATTSGAVNISTSTGTTTLQGSLITTSGPISITTATGSTVVDGILTSTSGAIGIANTGGIMQVLQNINLTNATHSTSGTLSLLNSGGAMTIAQAVYGGGAVSISNGGGAFSLQSTGSIKSTGAGLALNLGGGTATIAGAVESNNAALALTNSGQLDVNSTLTAHSGGITINNTGAATLNADVVGDGAVSVTNSGGTFTTTSAHLLKSTGSTLTAHTGGGAATLGGSTQTGGGALSWTNVGIFNINGPINTNGGAVTVDNTGAMTLNAIITSGGGAVSMVAHSPFTITSSGGVFAGAGNVTLEAGASGSTGDDLIIAGSVTSTGSVSLKAGNNITISGSVPGGASQQQQINATNAVPTLADCIANPALSGCSSVLPTLAVCTTAPTTLGCSVVLPTIATCTSVPSTAGCTAVLPTLTACIAAPATSGCSAVLPTLATCIAAPTTTGCSAVLPAVDACAKNPALAGCSSVLPTLAQCTAAPSTAGCSAVLPTLASCISAPATAGCSAVLPNLAVCTAAPTTAGCSAVLPSLATCTSAPSTAGCSAVLPTLNACVASPATAGCSAVLPTLAVCVANPSATGCSAVLPTLASCIATPSAAGCNVVLPTVAQCTSSPTLPGCQAVLPTLATCTAVPTTAGCAVVLPTLAECAASPSLAGCAAVLPTVSQCSTNPNQAGCAAVTPTTANEDSKPVVAAVNQVINVINTSTAEMQSPAPVQTQAPAGGGSSGSSASKTDDKSADKQKESTASAAKDSNVKPAEPQAKLYCN